MTKKNILDLSFSISCLRCRTSIPWRSTHRCHHKWTEIFEWRWKIRRCLHTRRRHRFQRRDRRWRYSSRLILLRWSIRPETDDLIHCWQKWVSFVRSIKHQCELQGTITFKFKSKLLVIDLVWSFVCYVIKKECAVMWKDCGKNIPSASWV